jgi:hypothetical protein
MRRTMLSAALLLAAATLGFSAPIYAFTPGDAMPLARSDDGVIRIVSRVTSPACRNGACEGRRRERAGLLKKRITARGPYQGSAGRTSGRVPARRNTVRDHRASP